MLNPLKTFFVGVLMISVIGVNETLGQCGCTFTIPANQYEVNGTTLGVKPGDVICLPGGTITSKLFVNINGTAANPVIIKNCGGKSYIERSPASGFGIDFSRSRHFRLTGTGDPNHFYGIEINGANQGVQIGTISTDFEVDHIQVYNTGYAGIAIKTNPGCNPETWRENYTMYNVKVHDNYVHETTGEGFYIGNSHYHFADGVDKSCSGVTIKVNEHAIRNCEVYNNIVENTGRDGIQVGAVIEGGKVYNNRVTVFGIKNPDHINGIQINPGFVGVVYNNFVTGGVGYGIQSIGIGANYFNNIITNCGAGGIFIDSRGNFPGYTFNVFNNTLIKNGRYGLNFLNLAAVNNKFFNNIIVSDGSSTFKYISKHPSAQLESSNNYETTNINALLFEDPSTLNFRIKVGSPAIDAGRDVTSFGITFDYDNKPRPVNTKFDQGAHEFQTQTIGANAGPDVSITLPTNSVVLNGSGTSSTGVINSYLWTKKSGGSATLTNPNLPALTVTNLEEGTYVFQLQVTDAFGSAIDEAVVTVLSAAVNSPPVANAGPDRSITLPTNNIVLNGTGTDTDGSIASHLWAKISGPDATLTNANTANLSLTDLLEGTYEFELTVTDDDNATGTDRARVTVNAAPVNIPPVVNAGVDKTIPLPTNSVLLNGTATDTDGSISSLLWEKKSGPTANLLNTNTLNLTANDLVEGSYVFRLTAEDNLGEKSFDEVSVDVITVNQNPVVNAGTDRSITLPTMTLNLTGSGTDTDGTIASYLWTQVGGPSAVDLVNANSATVTFNLLTPVAGVYTLGLLITDNDGGTGYDEVNITVLDAPLNISPVANAGTDKTIKLPLNTLTLNGTGTDADGAISSFIWSKKSGPSATLANETTKDLLLENLVAGNYTFNLRVTDNEGATGDDEVNVTVLPESANQAPVANAGGNRFLTLPTNFISLTGIASDPDGTVVAVQWTKEQGPTATITGETDLTVDITDLVEGEYVFRFTVTDNQGATASAFVSVLVSSGNIPPIVSVNNNQNVFLPTSTLLIEATGTDPDGTITDYLWTIVSGASIVLVNETTPSVTVNNLTLGTFVVRITVTDNNGATSFEDVTITVLPESTNQIPSVSAGSDQIIFLPTNSTNFTANAQDPDGTISSIVWIQLSGPVATLINETNTTVTVTNLLAGLSTFRVTVTDNDGATNFDDVSIQVYSSGTNQLPLVNAGANQFIQLPTNQTSLLGTAADNDGTIATYTWSKISGPTCTLSNQSTPTLTVTNLVEGLYIFRLTVSDNTGGLAFDEVQITVLPAEVNKQPISFAGQNQTLILPTNNTILVGSGNDPDGTIVSYLWTKISGPASFTITSANSQITTLTDLVEGVYTFRLTITDDDGASGSDDINIIVNSSTGNIPPIADAGGSKTITLPTNSVNLFGSGTDADGSVVSYAWTKITGGSATLVNTNSPILTINDLQAGSYSFRLRVTDNNGATNDDIANVFVNSASVNLPPIANAGIDKTIVLPTNSITINGQGTDSDGQITSYLWEKVSGGALTFSDASLQNVLVSNLVEGTYILRLTVTDNFGATNFDEMILRVLAPNSNIPPSVDLGDDIVIFLPTNATTIAANAEDPDGTITSFFWSKLSGPQATLADPNVKDLDVSDLVEGVYTFQITIIDDRSSSASDQVKVTVFPATVNQSPIVNAGPNITITFPTNSTPISATASDTDGSIADILWIKISGGSASLTNETTLNLQLADLVVGTYEFEIRVTDNLGAFSTDRVLVIVQPTPPNSPPIANAGENVSIELPFSGEIIIQGSGSDADGTVENYQWSQVSGPSITLQGTSTPNLSISNFNTEGPHVFRLVVTDNEGATDTDDVVVFAFQNSETLKVPPVAIAGEDRTVVLPDNNIQIIGEATDEDGTIQSFEWSKLSGPAALISTPEEHILELSELVKGEYEFSLTVMDNDSLYSSDQFLLLVTETGEGIVIPKYFSPNNDGTNDTWVIRNVEAINGCPLTIYTREGRKIYETSSYDNTWNGLSIDGRILSDGDYYYVIKCDGKTVSAGGLRIIR